MGPEVLPDGPPPPHHAAHFLYQEKFECRFLHGTQQMRYLYRGIYGGQEIFHFDIARGEYMAVTALGQPDVDRWNRDPVELQLRKARLDGFCRPSYKQCNYEAVKPEERLIGRRGEGGRGGVFPGKGTPGPPLFISLNQESPG